MTIADSQAEYPVRLLRNRQARRYTLRIHSTTREVILTIPPRGNLRDAQAFAEKHNAWIAARLQRMPEPVPIAHGTVLPLRGEPHRVVHRRGMRGTVWVEIGHDSERLLCVAGGESHISRRVVDFFKREARRDLGVASRHAASILGVGVARICVRDQVSRWGSCSVSGVLSYSWRLVLAPPFVLNYVAAHEAAHLVEMNHSPKFWRLVAGIDPDFIRAKRWLDCHGQDLHRYGLTGPAAGAGLRAVAGR
jgi:hypothetical protein